MSSNDTGIDRKFNLTIDTVELASTEAGKLALKGGSADLILSDWLWVARERSLGDTLVFYPTSSALGAVIAIGLRHGPLRGLRTASGILG
jgi:NitT/TauT family transport system substrate-binding protein